MMGTSRGLWAIGLMVAAAGPAAAQFPPGGGMFRGGGAMLLANPGVQKELKLTDEQARKAREFAEGQREKMTGLRDASPDEIREARAAAQAETKKAVAAMLQPDQAQRFHQIRLQNEGLAAFEEEEVAEKLKLTVDQKRSMREIARDTQSAVRDLVQDAGDRQAAMAKAQELRKSSFDKAVAALTAEQKSAWKEMTGEPFEVRFEPRRREN